MSESYKNHSAPGGMTYDKEIARLADEGALRRLIMRYAQSCDQRDGVSFAALYAPGAVLEGEGFRFAGSEEIGTVPQQLNVFKKTYHTLLNFLVEVNGDRATGEAYSAAHHLTPLSEGKYNDLVMYITYRDRYVRGAGGWLFEYRRPVIEFTENRIVEDMGAMPKA
jgi:hypothetical protein